jgi:polyisoprenoid-binding protein YceI
MGGKLHAGFSATTTISRTAFDLGTNYPAAVLGDDVQLNIDLDVVKQ